MKKDDCHKLQLKQIEQLANIGYWEWHPNSDNLIISEGLKRILSFIGKNIHTKTVIRFF